MITVFPTPVGPRADRHAVQLTRRITIDRQLHVAVASSLMVLLLATVPGTGAEAGDLPRWAELTQPTSIRSVGGSKALSRSFLADAAALQGFFVSHRSVLEEVLAEADWDGPTGDLFAAVEAGQVTETSLPVGTVMPWMAFRRGQDVDVIRGVRWAGAAPLEVFIVRLASEEWLWTFAIPKACGNISLLSQRGTGELIVKLDSGELQLRDPDGAPIVISQGESGAVSVSPKVLEAARMTGERGVPATVAVSEGVVEFQAYGGPVNLLVEAGSSATARITPDGHLSLALPESNPGPLRIKVGDAIGTISAGAGLAADWTPPECHLTLSSDGQCVPAQVVVDASGSRSAHGVVDAVEVTMTGPDGTTSDLVRLDPADDFRRQHRLDEPGHYSFSAIAVSDHGQRSTNACVAEIEIEECLPPPPTCGLVLSATQLELFDRLVVDASGSSSPSGELDAVVVEVVDRNGKIIQTVELDQPYVTTITPKKSGTYTYRAYAVDSHGQRSQVPRQGTVLVNPRLRITAGTFIAHEQRLTEELGDERSSMLIAAEGGFSYLLRKNLEIGASLGGFFNTDDGDASGVFADGEINWIGSRGFAGLGVGMWDPTNSETDDLSWFLHAGQDTRWRIGGQPVQFYLEARFFLDSPGNAQDNFVFGLGARLRLN